MGWMGVHSRPHRPIMDADVNRHHIVALAFEAEPASDILETYRMAYSRRKRRLLEGTGVWCVQHWKHPDKEGWSVYGFAGPLKPAKSFS
jgi:hypothetical protein